MGCEVLTCRSETCTVKPCLTGKQGHEHRRCTLAPPRREHEVGHPLDAASTVWTYDGDGRDSSHLCSNRK